MSIDIGWFTSGGETWWAVEESTALSDLESIVRERVDAQKWFTYRRGYADAFILIGFAAPEARTTLVLTAIWASKAEAFNGTCSSTTPTCFCRAPRSSSLSALCRYGTHRADRAPWLRGTARNRTSAS